MEIIELSFYLTLVNCRVMDLVVELVSYVRTRIC